MPVEQRSIAQFVRTHLPEVDACFSPFERNGHRLDETPQAVKLISLARKELRYDNADSDIEIFMSIIHEWLDIKKQNASRKELPMAAAPKPQRYGPEVGEW